MTSLLHLALDAITDADAQVVLGDAVLESGWWHKGVVEMLSTKAVSLPKNYRRFRSLAATPTSEWARAVYTVLLFEEWSGPRSWPVAERARRHLSREDFYAIFRDAWQSSGITEMTYTESPILGMLPKRSPLVEAFAAEQDAAYRSLARQYESLLYAPMPRTIVESDSPMQVYADPSAPRDVGYLVSPNAQFRVINLDTGETEKESDKL